jgi:hypothetical protein
MPLESESQDELLGATISGRYRVISQLGAGGMGVAYRAWDEQGGVPVVIKIPKRIFLAEAKFAERFYREIRLLQGLKHPHVVPIVDVGDHEGLPFVVMRFLPGGSLSNRRLRDDQGKPRSNPPAMLHLWLPAVAAALDHVHSQGVVHRDVKPGNIFFDAFWNAYLGDFGIAKIVEESDMFDKEQTLTATHVGIGTQEYMAPEQFTPKAVIDGRADQYALAVMVYEMLAGGRPFTGSTAHIVVEVTTYPVPPLPVRRSDVSPALIQAVHKALSKQPAERFATCCEFAAAVLRDVPMMRDEPGVARLLCPQCSNILKLPTTAADQKGKCPRCQTQMKVAADLGSLWLLEEARKQRKSTGGGGQETPVTPSDEIDEKALETFKPVSSETPIGRAERKGKPLPRWAVAGSAAAAAIALMVLAISLFGGSAVPPVAKQTLTYEAQLAEALKTLERAPLDQRANEFVGRRYCFEERNWSKGLSYLAKSGIPGASILAQEEIAAIEAKPIRPGQFIRVARKWWDYAGSKDLNMRGSIAAIREHAAAVYKDQVSVVKEEADIVFANEWLDNDDDFRKLVDNRRPMPLQSTYPSGVVSFNGHTYWFSRVKTNQIEARLAAEKLRGALAVIDDAAENAVVAKQVDGPTWIGIGKSPNGWSRLADEGRVTYFRWDRGQPSNGPGEVAVATHRDGVWHDHFASDVLFYVVEWPHAKSVGGDAENPPFPNGTLVWEENGHGYKAFREKLLWPEAKQRCEEMGGHLVSITSPEEQQFIHEVVSMAGIPVDMRQGMASWQEKLWIGGTDEGSEGKWRWVDGSPWGFTEWVKGQPDGDGNFVNICPHIAGRWNDDHAVGARVVGFICEWPKSQGRMSGTASSRQPPQSLGEDSDNRELQQKQTRQFPANRSAAEWVLQQGGSVEIELVDKSRKRVTALEELRRLQAVGEGEVVKAEQRLRWQNKENVNSRLVYHAKEQAWREEDSMGNYVFSFTERARSPECVELFDASRKVVLRVYASKVIYSEEAGNTFELWRGSWVDYRKDTQPYCVVGIELTAKPDVTDQGLACVAELTQLEWLGAGGTQVTDAMFEHLRSLTNLRGIGVNWTRVSGHGLATLADAQLKHLEISGMKEPEVAVAYLHKKGVAEWINFDGMKMSSECVRLLGEMKTLKALHFREGLITPEQLGSLNRQLPACHIHIWK